MYPVPPISANGYSDWFTNTKGSIRLRFPYSKRPWTMPRH